MWLVSKLEMVPRTYSFESAGLGRHEDVALVADGETLVNMGHLVDWTQDPVQLSVCESCGFVDCESGNHLALRRLGDFIALVPSAASYRAGTSLPYVVHKKGVPLVHVDSWMEVRGRGFPLPAPTDLRPLRWGEAWLTAQFAAPFGLLGQPGAESTALLSSRVVATDPWMDPVELTRLGTFGGWSANADAHVALVAVEPSQVVSCILEGSLEEVSLFAKVGTACGLLLGPGLMMRPEGR